MLLKIGLKISLLEGCRAPCLPISSVAGDAVATIGQAAAVMIVVSHFMIPSSALGMVWKNAFCDLPLSMQLKLMPASVWEAP